MKKRVLFIMLLLTLVSYGMIKVIYKPAANHQIGDNQTGIIRLPGFTETIYSPSKNFLALQQASGFVVLPAQNLQKLSDDLAEARRYDGKILGFLPSETLVYSKPEGIFAFDPVDQTSRQLFSGDLAEKLLENEKTDQAIVIASNDLIITGDGSYDWGGNQGHIYRFDLKENRVTKGAAISDFWYASLSPNSKFILYEHGAENNNNADLYSISENKNYPVADYFNFKKTFPEFKETDEVPISWLNGRDRFLAQISLAGDEDSGGKMYLALFDVSGIQLIWKKKVDKGIFPTDFHQLNDQKALLSFEDGVYELSLENGKLSKNPSIDGQPIAVAPNGQTVAFIKSNQLLAASADGGQKNLILDLPADWKPQTAYKGMKERSPLWSADGNWLFLFGENELLLIKHEKS